MIEVDNYIAEHSDWQAKNLIKFRELVHEVAPDVQEDFKWSCPVFTVNKKSICAMSVFSQHTKFNFFKGATITDANKLFNSGLDSKTHRSINLKDGDDINYDQVGDLIRQAAAQVR